MLQVLVTPTVLNLLTTAGKLIEAADLDDEELPGEFLVDEKVKEIERFLSEDAWSKLQIAGETSTSISFLYLFIIC